MNVLLGKIEMEKKSEKIIFFVRLVDKSIWLSRYFFVVAEKEENGFRVESCSWNSAKLSFRCFINDYNPMQ